MAKYRIDALNDKNELIHSTMIEEDLDTVKEKLSIMNFQVIRIKKAFSFSDVIATKTLNSEDLADYCNQVAIILDSGVTILRGIDILVLQEDKPSKKIVLKQIQRNLQKGLNLSGAMKNTGVFPELLTDMISSGEMSGNLPQILYSMEDFYTREATIRSRIKSASIYPTILLAASVLMVLFFNFFVFSELKSLFTGIKNMPAITAALINTLEFLNTHPFTVIVVIGILIFVYKGITAIDAVKLYSDRVVLTLPVIGRVKKEIMMSRITSSMAIFIKSAIPLVKAMTIVEAIVSNKYIEKRIVIAKEDIIRGQSIATAFDDCDVFDPMMIQMIRVGEETGKLEDMLFRLASIYEKKCNVGISRMVAMIEPMFTLFVGVLVGFVIVAMALPIFQMSNMYR